MIVWILRFSRYQEQLWDLCFSPLSCKVYVCVRVYMRVTCLALATAQWWDMEPFSFCSFTHIFCPSHAVCLSLCRMISCMGSQWCYVPQSPALTMTVLVKEHKATVWTQYFALSRSAFARCHLETPSQGASFPACAYKQAGWFGTQQALQHPSLPSWGWKALLTNGLNYREFKYVPFSWTESVQLWNNLIFKVCCPYATTAESFHQQQTPDHCMQGHTLHAKWTSIICQMIPRWNGRGCIEMSSNRNLNRPGKRGGGESVSLRNEATAV